MPVPRDLARRADAATEAAATLAAGRLQHIRIAAPGTTFTDVLAPFLATLHPDDPLPAVSEEPPQLIYAAPNSGADLAISTEQPPAGLASQPLAVLPVWAYVPREHDWASRGSITVAELVLKTLLLLTPDYSPRRVLDHCVDQVRLTYSSILGVRKPARCPSRFRRGSRHRCCLRRSTIQPAPVGHHRPKWATSDQVVCSLGPRAPRLRRDRGTGRAVEQILRRTLRSPGGAASPKLENAICLKYRVDRRQFSGAYEQDPCIPSSREPVAPRNVLPRSRTPPTTCWQRVT